METPLYLFLLQPVVSAFIGALVVFFFGIKRLGIERRSTFRERQLAEFYAPLAGIRKQIRAKSEVRLKISNAANSAWQKICASYGDRLMEDHEERFAPFKKIIEYDNEELKAELIPKYLEMLTIFTEKYHLAAADTREFYGEFLEFVEIWNRWLSDSLPGEVVRELNHSEAKVVPFYNHLEKKMQKLQDELT
jgi:hypothetical protein